MCLRILIASRRYLSPIILIKLLHSIVTKFIVMQGVTKRCRLSWLTNSALVYASPNAWEWGVAGSQTMRTAVHITCHGAQINFGDLTPYLTYVVMATLYFKSLLLLWSDGYRWWSKYHYCQTSSKVYNHIFFRNLSLFSQLRPFLFLFSFPSPKLHYDALILFRIVNCLSNIPSPSPLPYLILRPSHICSSYTSEI